MMKRRKNIKIKYKNTLQKGSVRYIVFKEDDTWHAVGLEFNIVESGDDPDEVLFLLFEALRGYVHSAKKIKSRPHILNQKPDSEYEKMWKDILDAKINASLTRLNKQVYTYGEKSLVPA